MSLFAALRRSKTLPTEFDPRVLGRAVDAQQSDPLVMDSPRWPRSIMFRRSARSVEFGGLFLKPVDLNLQLADLLIEPVLFRLAFAFRLPDFPTLGLRQGR